MSFRSKLIISFLIIFGLFAAGIVVYENYDAKIRRDSMLKERLDVYAMVISKQIAKDGWNQNSEKLISLFPEKIRITIIEKDGKLLYDNALTSISENHSNRPEIIQAIRDGSGSNVRTSSSNNITYLYYAKNSGDGTIVRLALPNDSSIHTFIEPDNAFLYFMIVVFLIGVGMIYYVASHFGKSVRNLRDFSILLSSNSNQDETKPIFPDDELGEIGQRLVDNIQKIRKNQNKLKHEREKLMLHIQSSAEGVCFFYSDGRVAFYNGLFLHYYNIISDSALIVGQPITREEPFTNVFSFLEQRVHENFYEQRFLYQGKEFTLRVNLFDDKSYEFILIDITAKETTRKLKTEMTGNIAHELRTPVTSIRGFLEILLNESVDESKYKDYLRRAYVQSQRLSELISDMSLLSKISDNPEGFVFGSVSVSPVAQHVKSDLSELIADNDVEFHIELPDKIIVRGNENLIYSMLRNLTENAILHAGRGVVIVLSMKELMNGKAYFSFSDNGPGISPAYHLNRIFDRFYRVGEGRTRTSGGSGLGLSIVRNIVAVHGGDIMVRNREGGGLQFLFSLPYDVSYRDV